MQIAKAEANFKGFLIPFKNGVLNSVTKEFSNHDPSFYSTHIISANYDADQTIENSFISEFLSQFVDYRPQHLNLLRAYLNIVFTNNTRYQVAFYIYGPGGTGKSTLINIILYLIGTDAAYSTSLQNLNSRFGLSRISHKIFLVINDMSHFKGKEPKILKEIITGDSLESEKKYKDSISVNPHVIVAITGNSIWEIVNPTGGINRRIIYFPSDFLPQTKDFDLFNLNAFGGAEGKIVPCLPGFIN
jgi:putative DNA primase/helicase